MTDTPTTPELTPTPGQTVGPFYGYALPFDHDNELVPPGSARAVQLTGTVSQTCAAGAPPAPWTVTATVETHRANDGTWRVNQQLQ